MSDSDVAKTKPKLKLISFSKLKMLEALKEILKDIEPLNEN